MHTNMHVKNPSTWKIASVRAPKKYPATKALLTAGIKRKGKKEFPDPRFPLVFF